MGIVSNFKMFELKLMFSPYLPNQAQAYELCLFLSKRLLHLKTRCDHATKLAYCL